MAGLDHQQAAPVLINCRNAFGKELRSKKILIMNEIGIIEMNRMDWNLRWSFELVMGPRKGRKRRIYINHGDTHIDHKSNDNGFLVNHRNRGPYQSSRSAKTLITKNILGSNNIVKKTWNYLIIFVQISRWSFHYISWIYALYFGLVSLTLMISCLQHILHHRCKNNSPSNFHNFLRECPS